jgi:hypothetical protein
MRRLVLLAGAAGWLALHRLGRTYGSTRHERLRAMPGDGYVDDAQIVATHAVDLAAPPEDVWPWLVQVGWHRAGWYTARWVDRLLFPANWPSADRIIPALQDTSVGDFIPDGPPDTGCGLIVERLERDRVLVLHSNSHLPARWRAHPRVSLDWSWAFVLQPIGQRTRFVFRSRWTTAPWWLTAGGRIAVVPADFVMSRDMLRGVKRRAEALARCRAANQTAPTPEPARSTA